MTAKSILDVITTRANLTPAAPAILSPGRAPLDYRGLQAQMFDVGRVLNEMGIGQGDRVALLMSNGPEAAVVFLSVSSFATAIPVNPESRAEELRELFRTLQVDAVMADPDHSGLASTLAKELGAKLFHLNPQPASCTGSFRLSIDGLRTGTCQRGPSGPGSDALLLQTSGTTGMPKIVPLTHENLLANAASTVEFMALTSKDRGLCLAPFFHKQGLVTGLLVPLVPGGSVLYPPAFDAALFFEWLRAFAPSWYLAGPTMHEAILEQARLHPDIAIGHNLRFIRSGASALPIRLMKNLEQFFAVPVIEAYGMSEAGIACNPLPPAVRKPGKVGLPITDVAIMGMNDQVLGVGETGEIAVRGPCVARGYINNPTETSERFRKGWFFTGDLGRLDQDGYLEVTGRTKEMINRGGRKVDPHQVEESLRQFAGVQDAAAFPVPHPTLGEDLVAAVVLTAEAPTPQQLRLELFRQRSTYKVPSRILQVDTIPRGLTGKLDRLRLSSKFESRLKAPFVAPESQLELEITKIFEDILHVENVGIHDNFYGLGGDSLKLLELIMVLEKRLLRRVNEDISMTELTPAAIQTFLTTPRTDNVDIQMQFPATPRVLRYAPRKWRRELFRVIRRVAKWLGHKPASLWDFSVDFRNFHFIGFNLNGQRRPLFWFGQYWTEVKELGRVIGAEQPLYTAFSGFPPNRSEDWRRALGLRHAQVINTIQPHGAIAIGGNCAGAYVAWETAQALRAMNRQVDQLYLLEATILKTCPGRVVMIYGTESLLFNPFLSGRNLHPEWRRLFRSYEIAELPGNHGDFFKPSNVRALADLLNHHLDAENAINNPADPDA